MIEAYSQNVTVPAESTIPFNNVTLLKGHTTTHPSVSTFDLNSCGIYMVSVDVSSTTDAIVELYKDGVAQPQSLQTGGTNVSFVTLVQVGRNNNCCACSSPVTIDVRNVGTAEVTCDANIVITKII